jgi:hypothetical protein
MKTVLALFNVGLLLTISVAIFIYNIILAPHVKETIPAWAKQNRI